MLYKLTINHQRIKDGRSLQRGHKSDVRETVAGVIQQNRALQPSWASYCETVRHHG